MVAENSDMRHGEWLTGIGATATRVATNTSASSQFSLVSAIHVILIFEYSACGRFNVQCTVLCMIVFEYVNPFQAAHVPAEVPVLDLDLSIHNSYYTELAC